MKVFSYLCNSKYILFCKTSVMTIRNFLFAAAILFPLVASSQTRDPNNKYLVWTNNIIFTEEKSDTVKTVAAEEEEQPKSFIEQYFRYVSMCDWQEGMKFMVIPDKKDMVVRTFADSTDHLVSSLTLRHKIMVYKGHSGDGRQHERVNFFCEDDGKSYYYELPTASFDDYCYSKFGVPTLAYLGDVDTAVEQLVGKRLKTKHGVYNVDVSTTSYGYEKINVPIGTLVTVVAAGVGTRNYPVKLIVADDTGREFFQTVAISRTNSGMRDNEFVGDEVKHTFDGSFEIVDDHTLANMEYDKYVGRKVFTLYTTVMTLEADGSRVKIPRMTGFEIKAMEVITGTNYVKMTLESEGKLYQKKVTFVQDNVASDVVGTKADGADDYYFALFASGNVGSIQGVRQKNLPDIRRAIVRKGFNEVEVKMALGNPSGYGKAAKGVYTWIYNSSMNANRCIVCFDATTKTVVTVKK